MASSTAKQQSTKADGCDAQATKLQFEVVAGIHRGVALMLDKTDYRIGCSPRTDIVLSDPGIAPEHAVLRVEGATACIDATGGEISVGQKLIPLAHGCRVLLPAEVALGEARLYLSRPATAGFPVHGAGPLLNAAGRLLADKPIATASTLICSAFVVTAVALGLPQTAQMNGAQAETEAAGARSIAADRNIAVATVTAVHERSSNTQSVSDTQSVSTAARDLSAHLDAAKIYTLRVSVIDGRLAVSGKLTKQQTRDWTAIQQWFDKTYGSRIVLTADVSDDSSVMPTLQLQAIWYGDHPYIITAEGARYYKGAVLDNGWIIREITADRLLLARDGETVALTY